MVDKYKRPTFDESYIEQLTAIGKRSTCDRGRAGAIITFCNHIVTTGYCGSPPGEPHCDDVGHLFENVITRWHVNPESDGIFIPTDDIRSHCIRTIHAEMNAIMDAAEMGKSLRDCTLYTTMFPCYRCAMAIVRVGITRVVAVNEYHASIESRNMLLRGGLEIVTLNNRLLY